MYFTKFLIDFFELNFTSYYITRMMVLATLKKTISFATIRPINKKTIPTWIIIDII